MELNQLEFFKTVAELQHFTKASQKLGISQPALSRSIARLEEELGFPLFERIGKTIKLTQYGQIFLVHVDKALKEIAIGRRTIADIHHPNQGTVSLAFLHSLGSYFIPSLLSKFNKNYPQINFKLHQSNSSVLFDELLSGEFDLCLCSPLGPSEVISWVSLFTEELFLIVPTNHPLATRPNILLSEVENEAVVTLKQTYVLRTLTDYFFKEASINPHITFEGEDIMTVAGLVEAGLGVALIPHIVGLNHLDIVFLPVSIPKCTRSIGLAWNTHKYLSPSVKLFRDFVIDSVHK